MVVDFVLDDNWVKDEGLCEGMLEIAEGWFPELRTGRQIDPLADRIRRASWGRSKIQLEMIKIEESLGDKGLMPVLPDWVTISTAYKPKAKKVRPINKNDRLG